MFMYLKNKAGLVACTKEYFNMLNSSTLLVHAPFHRRNKVKKQRLTLQKRLLVKIVPITTGRALTIKIEKAFFIKKNNFMEVNMLQAIKLLICWNKQSIWMKNIITLQSTKIVSIKGTKQTLTSYYGFESTKSGRRRRIKATDEGAILNDMQR